MKGTKVLTLGAGHGISYMHAIHVYVRLRVYSIYTLNKLLWARARASLRRRSRHVFSALDYCTSTVKGG